MKSNEIIIGDRTVGPDQPPFIIAEMSGNHNQSLERALAIVDAAAAAGAHAVKLQTYTADSMTLDIKSGDFVVRDQGSLWHGKSLYSLYQKAYTPWEWHRPIFERCKEHGIVCFSAPFDDAAVDLLESLEAPCYKIASFENNHIPLIRRVAATGKPIIISTGLGSIADLHLAADTARNAGCRNLILLKCTSSYPASPENSNLKTIPHMAELFDSQVGLSDHTAGIGVATAAVAMGATIIEKHITLKRSDGGVDADFSLEPQELGALVVETKRAWQAIGKVQYGPTEGETGSVQFRRSLYIAEDMRAGEVFAPNNLRVIRPGMGMEPKYYELVLGRRAVCNLKKGTALKWKMIGDPGEAL